MAARADFAVVGRGLMGTACARHLAEAGHSVVLIGPDEPTDTARIARPFGSFHDAGRITRRIAHDPVWVALSTASIDRYDEIEDRSGLSFFTPCGGMIMGPGDGPEAGFMEAVRAASAHILFEHLTGDALPRRAPMFHAPEGTVAAFDPVGGVINPRVMRQAEERLAEAAGAEVVRSAVTHRSGSAVTLASGETLSAGHIILATGAYARAAPLTDRPPAMNVYQRTIVFAEVAEADLARLAQMPSLIYWSETLGYDLYVLPPIRYPDGRVYIKIGGEGESPTAETSRDLTAWFHSLGGKAAGDLLLLELKALMPDLQIAGTHTGACAVSFTATGYPYIARVSDAVTLLTGGNGAGAKCADELGRLGMCAALGQDLKDEGYGTNFGAVFDPAPVLA